MRDVGGAHKSHAHLELAVYYKTSVPVEGNQLIYSQHLERASERKMNSVESLNEAAFAEQAHSQR